MRLTFILAALGIVAFTIAGLSIGTAQAKTVSVEAGNFYFCTSAQSGQVCETTGVATGDTVTWNNVSGTHRVVQCTDSTFSTCTGGFDLGTFSSGTSVSQTFSAAGEVYYHCEFHAADMKGKITVVAAATATPTTAATTAAAQSGSATATVKAVPSTGGSPDDGSTPTWAYGLVVLGVMMLSGSGAAFAVSRRRLH